jgi:hypothetical protein
MKKMRLLISLALVMAAIGMMSGPVQAQQFASYTSGINVQNLSGSLATIVINFYEAGAANGTGGALVTPANDTIAANGVKNYFPLSAPSGFKGSIVISSDQPLGAVTNIGNSNLTSLDAYVGLSAGSTNSYLPLLHKGNSGYNSWYSVQNAGTSPATVTVKYSDTPGSSPDATITVAPNASVSVAQKDEAFHTAKLFAATLTSNQPIVVVVLQENANNVLAYTGFPAGSTLPVMPIINMNNSGYITGTQIYNLGSSSTNVTVSYKHGQAGTDCTETQTIPAKTMKIYTSGAFSGGSCGSAKFIGSGAVTTNSTSQPLAVVVNQLRSSNGTNGAAYNGFDPSVASGVVFMPTIFDRNSGWYTAFNLLNVGNSTTFVKCTFAGSPATSYTYTTGAAGLAAGSSVTVSQFNAIALKFVGSAICKTYTNNTYTTLNAGGKILTVVNELGPGGPDNLLSYDGINGN